MRVAGSNLSFEARTTERTISASFLVVTMGSISRASTIALATLRDFRSPPYL